MPEVVITVPRVRYLNPAVGHPDYALTMEEGVHKELNVGRLYTPMWDDSMESVRTLLLLFLYCAQASR